MLHEVQINVLEKLVGIQLIQMHMALKSKHFNALVHFYSGNKNRHLYAKLVHSFYRVAHNTYH